METSDHFDRERRRTKPRKRRSWAKRLMNPRTMKLLIGIGQLAVRIACFVLLLVKHFRE